MTFKYIQVVMYFLVSAAFLLALPISGFHEFDDRDFGVVRMYPSSKDEKPPDPNCTRDTEIIDRLLNGTGYNKFRVPSKRELLWRLVFIYYC